MYERTLEMTEGEIRRYYKAAKYKKSVIRILADLNCCKPAIIKGILDGTIQMDGKKIMLPSSKCTAPTTYTQERKEYKRKYYQQNKERILEKQRENYRKNPELRKEYNRRYAMTHDRSKYYSDRWKKKQEVDESHVDG